ncbi:MAG: MFS transporter [Plesiomonas sp.]|uniref:MFS transporter n=1 Tax=Plesiomonas sp. TaxID=2486279 RepID=UPI003F32566F
MPLFFHQLLSGRLTRILIPLLIGVFLNTVALSELNTLVPLWLSKAHVSTWQIGVVTSAYYVGTLVGALFAGRFVILFGYSRSYQLFCLLFILFCVGLWLPEQTITWALVRFLVGFACAGIWVSIESWLLTLGEPNERGQLLAMYMVIFYLGSVGGQLMLTATNTHFLPAMYWICGLMFLAALPLLTVKNERMSAKGESVRLLPILKLKSARIGIIGCLLSGVVLGSLFGLLPLFLEQTKMGDAEVGRWMALLISAAIIGQLPMGRLADKYGRNTVLLAQIVITLVCTCWLMLDHARWVLAIALVGLGFAAFTLYPIAMAQASEQVEKHELVAMNQTLLLSYTLGSLSGPMICALMIEAMGYNGLFALIALVNILFLFVLLRQPRHCKVTNE